MIVWLIQVLVWLCILGLIWWLLTTYLVPVLPPPIQQVARILITIVFVLILIYMLIGIVPVRWPGAAPGIR